MVSHEPRRGLSAFRRWRAGGASLFVLLIVLVAAERRLAEAHFNGHATAPALESNDVLDGDEIRVRLVVLNDDKAPVVAHDARTVAPLVARGVRERRESRGLGRPEPRGPPPCSSSLA